MFLVFCISAGTELRSTSELQGHTQTKENSLSVISPASDTSMYVTVAPVLTVVYLQDTLSNTKVSPNEWLSAPETMCSV